jgi:predicted acylesterase/phospholipase RssA
MDDASFAQLTRAIFQQATGAGSMFSGIAAKFYYIALLPLSIVALTLLLWYVFHKVPLLTIGKGVVIFVSLSALLISADKLSDIANKAPKRAWTPSGDMVILIALGIFLAEILIIFTLPDWRMGLSVLGALLATAAGIAYVWNLRGWLIENKFDEMLQRIGTGTKLGNISSDMHHVFCACEVQLSEMIYLSQHAIFAPSLGIFSSINIPTARAVRASAAFPFAFPPVFLPGVPIGRLTWNDPRDIKNRLSLLRRFMMVDGGVRDNLGVAWFEEFETLIEELVVISAAPNRRHRSVISALPGLNELYALLRQSFMPYEDRERLRRRHLSTQLLSKMWRNEPKVAGLVLHIEDSPYDLPVILVARSSSGGESFANARWQRLHRMFPDRVVDQIIAVEKLWGASGDQGKALIERASAAWEHLKKIEQTLPPIGDLIADDRDLAIKADIIKIMRLYNFPMIPDQSMVAWYQRTSKSTQVKTKLSAIQVEDAKNLLLHGYYLACTNLHIVLNWPLLEGLNNKSFAELYEN